MQLTGDETKTVVDLVRELRDEARDLFRQEIALARQETTEHIAQAGKNLGFLVGGIIIAGTGVFLLLAALAILVAVALHTAGMTLTAAAWLGPAIVGLLILAAGVFLLVKALKGLKSQPLKPERTIETLKEEGEWARERTRM